MIFQSDTSKCLVKSIHEVECPLVSIIVNNYNYARFLNEAVDSALSQTYDSIEVIVVDDGSVDNSQEIVKSYGNKVISLLKENGGQASAFNVGVAASHGDIILFLDSDDLLLSGTVQKVVEAFQSQPNIVQVHYRLKVIDAEGVLTGEVVPPYKFDMPTGDQRQIILNYHSFVSSPTSGNAFLREVLQEIFPVPEDLYRIAADSYLISLCAIYGSIAALDKPYGLYRIHGSNGYVTMETQGELKRIKQDLLMGIDGRNRQKVLFKELYNYDVETVGTKDLGFLKSRLISRKLDPLNHPLKESVSSLCFQGCWLYLIAPDIQLRDRVLFLIWYVGMVFVPNRFAEAFTKSWLYSEGRAQLIKKLSGRYL